MPPNEPSLVNQHTKIAAMGLAVDTQRAYYFSGAGPATSCQSVWASFVSNNSGVRSPEWYGQKIFNFGGEKGVKTVRNNLPDSSYKHFVSISPDPNIIMIFAPENAGVDYGNKIKLRHQRMNEILQRFFIWTKMNIDIPILEDWIPFIWKDIEANHPKAIEPLFTFGDCIGGWKIDPDAGWEKYIANKVKQGNLKF